MKLYGPVVKYKNTEYVLIKTNPKNYRVLNLKDTKQYNIPRQATLETVRPVTSAELILVNAIMSPNVPTTASAANPSLKPFLVGQIVQIRPEKATKVFTAGTDYVVIKVNPTTVGIAKLNPVEKSLVGTAPSFFLMHV